MTFHCCAVSGKLLCINPRSSEENFTPLHYVLKLSSIYAKISASQALGLNPVCCCLLQGPSQLICREGMFSSWYWNAPCLGHQVFWSSTFFLWNISVGSRATEMQAVVYLQRVRLNSLPGEKSLLLWLARGVSRTP